MEHYFQCQKYPENPHHQHAIAQAYSPKQAKLYGQKLVSGYRKDWEAVKVGIMKKGLRAKFTQHPRLQRMLASTNDEVIVEEATYDEFWGSGKYNKVPIN